MSFPLKMNLLIFTVILCTIISADAVLRFRSLRILDMARSVFNSVDPERMGGINHPCYRKCEKGDNRVCHYNFTVSQYTSMSTACGDCPIKVEDCFKKGCVPGGGHIRPIIVANLMMPGPSIQVCKGDYVEVDVDNLMISRGMSIHWHGMWQKETPYMDGTPYITQCPIHPHNSFKYEWFANPAGTNFWHSHVGFEEADGLYGSLIVRLPDDPLEKYYDYDLAEHVIIIWHWFPNTTGDLVREALQLNTMLEGYSFTINGHSTKHRVEKDGKSYLMPRAVFHVEKGKRYRFRTIFNTAVYCPVQVSIDNHKLLMIASDTEGFEPVEVDSYMFNAGERFDFVLNANQEPGNYWIRFRGLGGCSSENVNVSETAILRYTSSESKEEPLGSTAYENAIRDGVLLNAAEEPTEDYSQNSLVYIVNLTHIEETPKRLSEKPDHIINLVSDMNIYKEILAAGPYPQFNNLSFDFPPLNLLTQYEEVTPDIICTPTDQRAKECTGRYCTCPMVYPVKNDSLVEIVFIDVTTAFSVSHPIHLHGHVFYVVAEESVGCDISADDIKRKNEMGQIPKNFDRPPAKDAVMVQAQGYTIVRFIADNPGYWFMHCHISQHVELGMAVVIKVGEDSEMIHPPPSFPRCGSWKMPDEWKPLYKKLAKENADANRSTKHDQRGFSASFKSMLSNNFLKRIE